MVTMTGERFLTVAEIAEQLRVSASTVKAWLRAGRLRGVRLGGPRAGWRIRQSDLETFLRERETARDESRGL